MSIAAEIERLQHLHLSGALSAEEFAAAKHRVLSPPGSIFSSLIGGPPPDPSHCEQQTRTWAALLHFSQLAGFAVPVAGLIVPLVIWLVLKDSLPGLERDARNIANWIVSLFCYAVIGLLLVFFKIGVLILLVLLVIAVIFPLIGGLKASSGQSWKYPLSIQFFS